MRAYLRLLRFPNVFSAMADSLAGWLIVHQLWSHDISQADDWISLVGVVASSVCLYLAGMVLNDVFDYQIDLAERPERPLPAGEISLASAQCLGWGLLIAGIISAGIVSWHAQQYITVVNALVLAGMIVAYNAGLKHTWLGPISMGACRWLNVLLGMSTGEQPFETWQLLLAAGNGIYVAGITIFAKQEAEQSSRARLLLGTIVMIVGIAIIFALPAFATSWGFEQMPVEPKVLTKDWLFLWPVFTLLITMRCGLAIADPSPTTVQRAIGQCLQSLIILDALLCYSTRDLYGALLVMALIVPQQLFRSLAAAT
jgi:4-hydroxybenzoate polyprenyltransferase